jgi:hypothetical protein
MHPEVMLLLAHEHQAELARSAAWESQVERATAPRADRDPVGDAAPVAAPLVRVGHLLPLRELEA